MKTCGNIQCTNKVRGKTYCDECAKERAFKGTGNADPRYSQPEWRKLRLFVLTRDNGVCYLCKSNGADSVDHIKSVARGGSFWDESNLAAAHMKPCQYQKMNGADKRG